MIVNGTLDPLNKWEGGEIILANNVRMGRMRSAEASFRYWAQLAGYTGTPRSDRLPDLDTSDGKIIERYSYSHQGKPEVVLLKVVGDIDIGASNGVIASQKVAEFYVMQKRAWTVPANENDDWVIAILLKTWNCTLP
jgi:poly(3-hydroxybutyrate) depolymerase